MPDRRLHLPQYLKEPTAPRDTRSAAARAADARPFKGYTWGGEREEPPAVTAARQRHRALNEALAARLRELAAGEGDGDG